MSQVELILFFGVVWGAAAMLGYALDSWVAALVPGVVGVPLAWVLLGDCEVGPHSFATDCDAHGIAQAFWTLLGGTATVAMLLGVGLRRWRRRNQGAGG
jgi:hypothetical protein